MLKFNEDSLGHKRINPPAFSKNRYLRLCVEEFSVKHPQTGKMIGPAMREFFVSRPAIAVLVYCPSKRKLLMSRQFRAPVMFDTKDNIEAAWIYEVIAGVIDGDSGAWYTAIKEAEEEAGVILDPEALHLVGDFYSSPGISSEHIAVFTCPVKDTVPENPSGGLEYESEAIVSEWIDYEQAQQLLSAGQIVDFKTYVALKSLDLT